MRGRLKEQKTISLSGNVYLEYEDSEEISSAKQGDLAFYLILELESADPEIVYLHKGNRGYFKAKIFDGKAWCHINLAEILTSKENHFSKNEIPIYSYNLCKEILSSKQGEIFYKTYRNHYTNEEPYISEGYKGKKKFKK